MWFCPLQCEVCDVYDGIWYTTIAIWHVVHIVMEEITHYISHTSHNMCHYLVSSCSFGVLIARINVTYYSLYSMKPHTIYFTQVSWAENMSFLNVKLQFLCAICHNKCHILYIVMEETIHEVSWATTFVWKTTFSCNGIFHPMETY